MTVRIALLFALALLSASLSSAEPMPGTHRIGYLNPGSASLTPIRLEPLRQGLRELGYVEGRNLVLEARWGEGNFERVGVLATELIQLKVAVIVTAGAAAAQAARGATSTVPIVMVDPDDPVRTKLIESLRQPGGNMTGLSSATPDIAAKHLQLLKEAVPGLTRVGFLSNPNAPAGALALGETQEGAGLLGIKVQPVELPKADELDDALTALARA